MKRSELKKIIREELTELVGFGGSAGDDLPPSGKKVASRMSKIKTMKSFAPKVAKMKNVTRKNLEDLLPDYVSGRDIAKVLGEGINESVEDAENAIRDMFLSKQYNGTVPAKDIAFILTKGKNWHSRFGKANVVKAWNNLYDTKQQGGAYVEKKGSNYVWL